jgi:hypothetical protein
MKFRASPIAVAYLFLFADRIFRLFSLLFVHLDGFEVLTVQMSAVNRIVREVLVAGTQC